MRDVIKLKGVSMYVLLFFGLTVCYQSKAVSILPVYGDSVQPAKPHKMSQKEFIVAYKEYSHTALIINYFFKRRQKTGVLMMALGWPLAVSAGIGLAAIGTAAGMGAIIMLFLGLVVTGGVVVGLIGLIYFLLFPRRRLWKILEKYKMTGQLPRSMKRRLRL